MTLMVRLLLLLGWAGFLGSVPAFFLFGLPQNAVHMCMCFSSRTSLASRWPRHFKLEKMHNRCRKLKNIMWTISKTL